MAMRLLKTDEGAFDVDEPHPASRWAMWVPLDPLQIDCITAIMLKILDDKCRMGPEEQVAFIAIYHVVKTRMGHYFDTSIHRLIEQGWNNDHPLVRKQIHEQRLYAERAIPKSVMKFFKRFLRESLYGL
ncbi:MAG: hypothetical protein ABW068_07620 [Candidatus Thiodiazotropha sp.]